jgi:hypothetical protein
MRRSHRVFTPVSIISVLTILVLWMAMLESEPLPDPTSESAKRETSTPGSSLLGTAVLRVSAAPTLERLPALQSLREVPPAALVNAPSASVEFKFDDGVPPDEREFVMRAINQAETSLGDAGAATVYVYADFDALFDEQAKFYGRSASSDGSQTFKEYFQNGRWIAYGGSGAIGVWYSDRWKARTEELRTMTLVHEYFHLVQSALANKSLTQTGPLWLYEGAADLAAFRVVASLGAVNLDLVRAEKVTRTRGIVNPLQAVDSLEGAAAEDSNEPYNLGYLAGEFLISNYGGEDHLLKRYWEAQGQGATWQSAFQSTFGVSPESFYSQFEEYRRKTFPPFCGAVGSPIADATPAPLAIRFDRQQAPGAMTLTAIDSQPWTSSPNIPYTFCVAGIQFGSLTGDEKKEILTLPESYAGWASCGGNCVALYMRPDTPAGHFSVGLHLPDGRQAQAGFEHKP